DINRLLTIPSVALFVSRSRAVNSAFALNGENGHAVAEICRRLDGLPLALELAAAEMGRHTPQELLSEVDGLVSKEPTDAFRDLPDRQKTLRATIDWSYRLLNPEQAALFRSLAVFAGGVDREAAAAVAVAAGIG